MKAAVINLDHRTDRWQRCQNELLTLGVEAVRFSALSKPSPVIGNGIGHLELVRQGYDIVFEDDIYFEHYAKEVFMCAVSQLPKDWDILYLGGNVIEPLVKYSQNLYRCTAAWGSFAIMHSEKGKRFITQNYHPTEPGFVIYDEWLRIKSQNELQAYIVSPIICWTYGGHSDINGAFADYSRLMQKNAANNMK